MIENTIEMSSEIPSGDENSTISFYKYEKGIFEDGLEIKMCPGDLYKICNVLHDYERILSKGKEVGLNPAGLMMWDLYQKQLHKIRMKLEKALDYSVEDAIIRCEKKKAKPQKQDDVGEDAFTLAVKRGQQSGATDKKQMVEKAEEEKKQKKADKKQEKKDGKKVIFLG